MGGVAIFEVSGALEIQTPSNSIKDAVEIQPASEMLAERTVRSAKTIVWHLVCHAAGSLQRRRGGFSRLSAHAAHPKILSWKFIGSVRFRGYRVEALSYRL